jgi:hypothetical protein
MKLCLSALAFAALAMGQTTTPDIKHVIVPKTDGSIGTTTLSAAHIERGAEYPTVVKLSGSVEIRTRVCMPVGKKQAMVCDGYLILHADEAEFHEDTGQIEAHGNVTVTPRKQDH